MTKEDNFYIFKYYDSNIDIDNVNNIVLNIDKYPIFKCDIPFISGLRLLKIQAILND